MNRVGVGDRVKYQGRNGTVESDRHNGLIDVRLDAPVLWMRQQGYVGRLVRCVDRDELDQKRSVK